jgi:hypothetical protein
MKLEGLKQLVKEELKRVLNEEESEFDYDKALQDRMDQPSFLEDLELNTKYKVEYRARNMYGEKEIDDIIISITQDDLNKYGGNMSIQNYLTNYFNEDHDTGYKVMSTKSVKKL